VAVTSDCGSGSGWAGTWESTKVEFNSPEEWEIEANGANGLTFKNAAYQESVSMKFDGKDYPEKGPTVPPGSTTSGKHAGERTFELTNKIKGKW